MKKSRRKSKKKGGFVPKNKIEKVTFLASLDEKEFEKYDGKRNSFKRNFENTYLRVNILKRALSLPKERLDDIMADKEFDRITRYMALKVFNRYRDFLLVYGFDLEDILNISRVFGLNFYTSNYTTKIKKEENYLMLRYIGQRLHRFVDWSIKKFGSAMPVKPKIFMEDSDPVDITSLADRETYKDWLSDSILRPDAISGIIEDMKKPKPLSELKKKLDDNWQDHKETLAHYATTVYAPSDVRKKARSFCKKYGIDYVGWAKSKIESGRMTDQDIDLR